MGEALVEEGVQNLDKETSLKEQILASDKSIKEAWPKVRKMNMLIGWEGAFIEQHNGWSLLGFDNQHDYRQALQISRSTWYKHIAIAHKFSELDKKAFLAMNIENAARLGIEPPQVRYDPANVQKAATKPTREFRDELTTESAHKEGKPAIEKWVEMTWKMKEERREWIEKSLEKWCQENGINEAWCKEYGIDENAYALEMLLAESTGKPTLVGFMMEAIPKLTEAIQGTNDPTELKLLCANHIREMGAVVIKCCGEVEEVAV
jgi:hypothetical protein